MLVGLMTPGFSPQDAIGNDVLGMYLALTARNDEAIIFTPSGEAPFYGRVMHYADIEFMLDKPDDILIYHYCVYDAVAMRIFRRLRCRLIIRYHNVTPAYLMGEYSAEFGRSCRLGREMLTELPELRTIGFLSDSAYNAQELLDLGIHPDTSRVLPPLHKSDELTGLPDHAPTSRLLEQATYNVLAVGRMMPNKGFDIMMEGFALSCREAAMDIRLHHVGPHDPRMQRFTDRIGQILADYGVLDRSSFHGQAPAPVLATLFRHCDLFWTTSLHEGFCVPAVEAMAFGRPILSSRQAALPETCDDVAVYADSPTEAATKLNALLRDDVARVMAGRRSKARYDACFKPAKLKRQFLTILDEMIGFADKMVKATLLGRSGDWFGLPRQVDLLDSLLPIVPDLPPFGLSGRDRRLDLIDWALRHGPSVSPWLAAYVASPDLATYAAEIEMPMAARHFPPAMRLCWTFHRPANARFDLQDTISAGDFWRWYQREDQDRRDSLLL